MYQNIKTQKSSFEHVCEKPGEHIKINLPSNKQHKYYVNVYEWTLTFL